MSEQPTPFQEYEVPGVGTVIAPEGEPGYRVRLADGQVTAYPAHSGDPSPENAAADLAYAIANPAPAPVPQTITPAQFMAAVRKVLGLEEGAIYAVISGLPDEEQQQDARDLFERARSFRRDNPFLAALASANGNTNEELDQVFRLGATLFNE